MGDANGQGLPRLRDDVGVITAACVVDDHDDCLGVCACSCHRPAAEGDEVSVDLTPGVVWTDGQLDVVRRLTIRTFRAEQERDRLVEQAAEAARLRAVVERFLAERSAIAAYDLRRALDGTDG